jgi:hypothetical protein
LDDIPRSSLAEQRADVVHLVAEMIELQHRQVGFPAVDARMHEEVIPDSLLDLAATLLPVSPDTGHLNGSVLSPPNAVVITTTGTAYVVSDARLLRADRELGVRLWEPADPASDGLARTKFHLHDGP